MHAHPRVSLCRRTPALTDGRECRAPFTCSFRLDENNVACKCSRSVGKNNCAVCDYSFDGSVCRRCTNGRFLRRGVCVDNCQISDSVSDADADGTGAECIE